MLENPKDSYKLPKVLITREQIKSKVEDLGKLITKEYQNCAELIVIGVLKGSVVFISDLIREIDIPLQTEFIRLASYDNDTKSSGKIKPVDLTLPNLKNKDILVVEDIVDTGLTAKFFMDYLNNQHHVKSLKLVAFLDKPTARKNPVNLDFVGFEIEDKFVVGYGLDYAGYYRNLPYIGYFEVD